MVSVLTWSAVDRWFEPRLDQTKDNKIDNCWFSGKGRSIKEKEQRLVGLESVLCIQVELHFYSRTVVSVT
jgi:hypothetical protein